MRGYGKLHRATLTAMFMLVVMPEVAIAKRCVAVDAEGHYSETVHLQCLLQAARHGDILAQYLLGLFYYVGDGRPQNYDEALKWFGRSADQGHPMAQFMLAKMYAQGQGVRKDFVRAYMLLELAYTQGVRRCERSTRRPRKANDPAANRRGTEACA